MGVSNKSLPSLSASIRSKMFFCPSMKLSPSPPAVVIRVGGAIDEAYDEIDDLVSSSASAGSNLFSTLSFEKGYFNGLFG